MTEQEKRIEEMAKRHCGSGSSVHCIIDCDGICYCIAYKFAKDAIDAGYCKIKDDEIVISKEEYAELCELRNQDISLFVLTQAHKIELSKLRKETAKEIFNRVLELSPAYHYDTLSVAQKNLVKNEDFLFLQQLKDLAKKFGVEVEE